MRAHDLEVLLLANEPNIRYATGATAMPPYAMSTFVRCAVVPVEGTRSCSNTGTRCIAPAGSRVDVRRMHAWEFFDDPMPEARVWAGEVVAAMDRARRGPYADRARPHGDARVPRVDGGGMRVRGFGAGHAGRPRGQDARGDPPVPGQRADRDGAAAHGGGDDRPGGAGARDLRGHGADRAGPGGRVLRHEHGVLRPQHEPLAGRSHGPRDRARRPRLRRHRHGGRGRGVLLRLSNVRVRAALARAARHLPRRPSTGSNG